MLSLDLIGNRLCRNRSASSMRPSADFALARIGEINLVATRTTPCTSIADDPQHITLAMLHAGERYQYQHEAGTQYIEPGCIHVCQRTGGTAHIGHFSGIICEISRRRLDRTMNVMAGKELRWNPQQSYALKMQKRGIQKHLWSLFSYIDQLLGESSYLAEGLGLDEQAYRLLALSLFQEEGLLETIQKHWRGPAGEWSPSLDDLVDYIRTNTNLNLTLTDLEEKIHYSGRQLQKRFKEKFNCTPMQFARRERLSAAMERLQTAQADDSVSTIARDFGYAYASTFTTDFHRQFGITPSVVLRSSRGERGAHHHGCQM